MGATLLQSHVVSLSNRPAGLIAQPTRHAERWVDLVAVFDAPFVTRTLVEEAMVRFAAAGFPRAPQFQLRWGDPRLYLPDNP